MNSFLGMCRPGDFKRASKSVLLLHKDSSVRGDITSRVILFHGNVRKIRSQGFKVDLATFTSPDFEDVLMHSLTFIFSRADRNRFPVDLDLISLAGCLCPSWTWIIRGDRQFCYPRIYNRKTFDQRPKPSYSRLSGQSVECWQFCEAHINRDTRLPDHNGNLGDQRSLWL